MVKSLFSCVLMLGTSALAAAAPPEDPIAAAILAAHNRERAAQGAPPLVWDSTLASNAAGLAAELALEGQLRDGPKKKRIQQGENLWIGSTGQYSIEEMIESWAVQRKHFRPGNFPAVSTTGNSADVDKFTRIVWPTTRTIGCGLAQSGEWDVLVCRYAPAGNRYGSWVGRN